MLSLIVLIILLLALGALLRFYPKVKILQILLIIIFNILFIEVAAYGYLLFKVAKSDSVFLIGNQQILDRLIKSKLVDAIYLNPNSHNAFYEVDRDLGYTLGKSKQYWLYQSNAQGLRADREYAFAPADDTLRLAVFGDSFIFCDGELNQNTWENFLEKSINQLEVLNFGVSGYGLSASYLRFLKDGLQFHPDVVMFNYIHTGNRDILGDEMIKGDLNLKRSTLYRAAMNIKGDQLISTSWTPLDLFDKQFRARHLYGPLAIASQQPWLLSPVFSFVNTGLVLKQAYLQRKYNQVLIKVQDKENVVYNEKIIRNILSTAKKQGFTVLFFCDTDIDKLPMAIQQVLKQYEAQMVYLNGYAMLNEIWTHLNLTREQVVNSTSHYNAAGNTIYAQAIAMVLKSRPWQKGERLFRYNAAVNAFERAP